MKQLYPVTERLRDGDKKAEPDIKELDPRVTIARQLIRDAKFAPDKPVQKEVVDTRTVDERLEAIRLHRLQHTQQMLADPKSSALYNVKIERHSLSYQSLRNVVDVVYKQANRQTNLRKLVAILRQSIKVNPTIHVAITTELSQSFMFPYNSHIPHMIAF